MRWEKILMEEGQWLQRNLTDPGEDAVKLIGTGGIVGTGTPAFWKHGLPSDWLHMG
jgi:hypothetical protein